MVNHKDMKELSERIGCGYPLARDLLILAGGDKDIVIDASENTIEGIETVFLTAKDVVRHALVMEIIKAYEKETDGEFRRPDKERKD